MEAISFDDHPLNIPPNDNEIKKNANSNKNDSIINNNSGDRLTSLSKEQGHW